MKQIILVLTVLLMGTALVTAETDAGVKGAEGGAARFYLWADQGDDAADKSYNEMQADGDYVINVGGTDVLELDGSGNLSVIGTLTGVGASSVSNLAASGTVSAPVYKQTVYASTVETNILVATDGCVITADTTGGPCALTLPDANDVLGARYTIILVTDGGSNLTVARAGTDVFNASNNTLLTFADAEDAVVLTAIAANRWLIEENIGSVAASTP